MENFAPININNNPILACKKSNFTPQKVILLACPWVFQGEQEFQSQQLGLAYIGSYIEECGHIIVKYIDPMLDNGNNVKKAIQIESQTIYRVGHSDDWVLSQIPYDCDWILINVPFTDSRFVFYPLCNKIKDRFPNKTIVVGGILATTLAKQVLKKTKADIIVKGEGEIAVARILNGESLCCVPGIVYRRNNRIIENKGRSEQLSNINDIPWITKHNFRPMHKYINWSPRGNKVNKTFSYISSRGCPFTCEFCSIPEKGQRWRSFDSHRVVNEIQCMIDNYGVTHIEIEDDNFTLKSSHSIPILKYFIKLRRNGYPITPSFPNGIMIDRLDREHIFLLKEAGTEIVYLPVESGSLQTLIAMDKPVALSHLDKTIEVARWCREAGLTVGSFFIVGYPGGRVIKNSLKKIIYDLYKDSIIGEDEKGLWIKGEDEQSFLDTVDFASSIKEIGVKFITPLIATPYPGTELYDICKKFGWLRREDDSQMITTISYQNPKEEYVNINTPWCSYEEIFKRWKKMCSLFDIKHNIIKKEQ